MIRQKVNGSRKYFSVYPNYAEENNTSVSIKFETQSHFLKHLVPLYRQLGLSDSIAFKS